MNLNIRKVLIIHPGGIGDLIMFEPCLLVIKNNFPKAIIDIFTGFAPTSGQVIQEGRNISKIISFNWEKNNFFKKIKFIYTIRKETYDLAIVTVGVNPLKGSFFSYLTGAKVRVGEVGDKKQSLFYTHTALLDKNKHVIDANIDLLRAISLTIEPPVLLPSIKTSRKEKDFAQHFLETNHLFGNVVIGFHPGGGENQKFRRWPKEHFIELGRKILYNLPNPIILIFGGPGEKELCEMIKNRLEGRVIVMVDLPITQTISLIERCNVFVSSDSGLNHIAAALGVEAISMYGPTNPDRTGPRGPNVHILKQECRYPLNPYTLKSYDVSRHHGCLQNLTPEIVFGKVGEILLKSYERSDTKTIQTTAPPEGLGV